MVGLEEMVIVHISPLSTMSGRGPSARTRDLGDHAAPSTPLLPKDSALRLLTHIAQASLLAHSQESSELWTIRSSIVTSLRIGKVNGCEAARCYNPLNQLHRFSG